MGLLPIRRRVFLGLLAAGAAVRVAGAAESGRRATVRGPHEAPRPDSRPEQRPHEEAGRGRADTVSHEDLSRKIEDQRKSSRTFERFAEYESDSHGRLLIRPHASEAYSSGELRAGKHFADQGSDVILRKPEGPRSRDGGTSDLLVDGRTVDVYEPTTDSTWRLFDGVGKKSDQARSVVIDISNSPLKRADLGDVRGELDRRTSQHFEDIYVYDGKEPAPRYERVGD